MQVARRDIKALDGGDGKDGDECGQLGAMGKRDHSWLPWKVVRWAWRAVEWMKDWGMRDCWRLCLLLHYHNLDVVVWWLGTPFA